LLDPVLLAVDARNVGDNEKLILAEVQMTPTPWPRIVFTCRLAANGAVRRAVVNDDDFGTLRSDI